jgi:hypothetical protein
MKYIIAIWAAPLVLFWGWFFLSLNDINFGFVFLTRQVHDLVFRLYGNMLGIDPATIPGMIADACLFDSAVIAAIWAFRRRREIAGWARSQYLRYFSRPRAPDAPIGLEMRSSFLFTHRIHPKGGSHFSNRAHEAGRARPAG